MTVWVLMVLFDTISLKITGCGEQQYKFVEGKK